LPARVTEQRDIVRLRIVARHLTGAHRLRNCDASIEKVGQRAVTVAERLLRLLDDFRRLDRLKLVHRLPVKSGVRCAKRDGRIILSSGDLQL
jgi:hypothetical protein